MTPLSGKKVLVTGAAGGIGLHVINSLLSLGAQIIAIDKKAVSNSEVKHLRASEVRWITSDLSDFSQIRLLGSELNNLRPDCFVALAGIVVSGELRAQSSESIRSVIDLNLTSQIELSKYLIDYWINEKIAGNIVYVSSWVDHVPWPGITPYAASKAGLVALCRGVAREYASYGIRANLISPGIVDVGMAAQQWREEPDYRARASRAIPLGRLQRPEEVAGAISFLLSKEASYMTGSNLLIDGGASLYPMDQDESSR